MEVTYWSDYVCPYCYIGESNLKKAAKELRIDDLKLDMKAFELDPTATKKENSNTVDHFAEKYRISTEDALNKVNAISIMAKDSGLDMDYSTANFSNTFNAHRLTKLAKEFNKEDEITEALFKAYFVDHKDLSDLNTLIEIGKNVGIEEKLIKELLESDKYNNEVRIEEQIAYENGINSVPFFIIDQKVAVPGALDVEQMKKVLKQVQEM